MSENDKQKSEKDQISYTKKDSAEPSDSNITKSNSLFLVYNKENDMSQKLISFLKEYNVRPILTRDKQNISKPLNQICLEHSDTSFAIVILSADDFVYPKDSGKPKDALMYSSHGVIFQLGFLIGSFGKARVIGLYYDQKSYRCPTEIFNAIYIPLDKKDLWKNIIKNHLSMANFEIK